jgi:adenine-specific DNA-methyltransferase
MMDWFRENYGKNYAPNTRETVRRFTIHQFEQMALVFRNPDEPSRPPNSPNNVYQVEPGALELIRSFGTLAWEKQLTVYLASVEGVNRLREKNRNLTMIEVTLPNGEKVDLTAGGQNVLVKEIVEQFCARYTPGGYVIYLGDAGKKHRFFDAAYLAGLGVTVDEHGQMPDVVIHHREKNWLILIEAVTSHGPVSLLRHNQLKDLFRESKPGLVFVSTFLDRRALKEYLSEISWQTEVWCADSPDHLIHFNGERFLGPYTK